MEEFLYDPEEALAEAETRIAECKAKKAQRLELAGLGIPHLPESIRELTWLTSLMLQDNRIARLPSWVRDFTELEYLQADQNPLVCVPPELGTLKNLTWLTIDGDKSIGARTELGALTRLEGLSVGASGLRSVPVWIERLIGLRTLWLDNNRLTSLPKWLGELPNLSHLDISGNPGLGLPEEVVRPADAKKILNYYFRIAKPEAAQPLNEFKLVLVGRGGVGKSTLVHKLVTDDYKEFPETTGIKITQWPVTIDGDEMRAHVWDFGGQEIMHGTHRFFMTERALYLVLISRRENTEDHDAEYWLSLVRSFAGEGPVIVLLHKCDIRSFELNRTLLREKYGKEIAFLETDSYTGTGIAALRDEICKQAGALPGLKALWPKAWRRVKEELPEAKKNWMTFDDFCAFCRARGVAEYKDQEALAESLHDLGLMLAYRKEEALRGFGVLNPQWVTNGIYTVLNAPLLKEAAGRFTVDDLAKVLPATDYPGELHPYLLALMRKFKLCHPVDDKGVKHLIPELLTKEERAQPRRRIPTQGMSRLRLPLRCHPPRGPAPAFHRGNLRPPRAKGCLAYWRSPRAGRLPGPRPRRRAGPAHRHPRHRARRWPPRPPRHRPRALRTHPRQLRKAPRHRVGPSARPPRG